MQALTRPDVAGKRIVASTAEPGCYLEVARILKDSGYEGPSTRIAPSFVLRLLTLFDREAKGMIGMLGMNLNADNKETRSI